MNLEFDSPDNNVYFLNSVYFLESHRQFCIKMPKHILIPKCINLSWAFNYPYMLLAGMRHSDCNNK